MCCFIYYLPPSLKVKICTLLLELACNIFSGFFGLVHKLLKMILDSITQCYFPNIFWEHMSKWIIHIKILVCVVLAAQLCPTPRETSRLLCPWNSPGKILEWVAMPSFRGSSWPRDGTQVSSIAGKFFTKGKTREGLIKILG